MLSAQRQPVTVLKVFLQLYMCQFSVCRRNPSHPDSLVVHTFRENDAGILAAQCVPVHKAAPVKDLEQAFFFLPVRLFEASPFQAVQALPVAARNHCHILRPLQPALQFDGGNARFLQFGQFIPQAYVPGAEPRAAAAAVIIFHPTGLGAPAPVSAPFSHHAGEKAKAAHRHALRAVGKDLCFNPCVRAFPDFRKRALPCQYHPADPLLFAPEHPGPVMDCHLGTCVHSQFRKAVPGNAQHSQVLDQHRVRMQVPQQAKHFRHRFQFSVFDQRVHGHVNTHMPQMGITNGVLQLLPVKIARAGARAESGIPKVYRVRTRRVRPFQSRAVSRRSQVLHHRYAPSTNS